MNIAVLTRACDYCKTTEDKTRSERIFTCLLCKKDMCDKHGLYMSVNVIDAHNSVFDNRESFRGYDSQVCMSCAFKKYPELCVRMKAQFIKMKRMEQTKIGDDLDNTTVI